MARQLRMVRPNLDDLPELELPEGYGMRSYLEGDEEHWARIISDSFGGKERTAQDTRDQITERDVFLPDGFYLATYRGIPVGTACAWLDSIDERDVGNVHMVGVVAEHTGHKLGKWVSLAVLRYLRENGFKCAKLDTDDFRIPAVKTYLNLGFIPVYVEEGQPERWQNLFDKLKLPPMTSQIENVRKVLSDELWAKVSA